jgi:uncharacterized membrane protein
MSDSQLASAGGQRIPAVDLARGVALLAMTVFHFCWDLEMFGVLPVGTMATAFARNSAHLIAGSFLALVGVSLVLAHGNGIRWPSFWRRWLMIAGAAVVITIATRIATPDAFIFFGILHSIAVGSILALPFLVIPAWLVALAGVAVAAAGIWLNFEALDAPVWWWTGLSLLIPRSNDYVPVFPYFGLILFGVALGKWAVASNVPKRLRRYDLAAAPARAGRFIGRHSLLYYLAHQPVMIGMLYAFLTIIGRI